MDFEQLIAKQRELYLNDLIDFYKTKGGGAKELLIELNNDELTRAFKLWRLDHCEQVNGEPKTTEFNSDKYLDFEPTEYLYNDLKVELSPFYWNGCDFELKPVLLKNDWLMAWVERWINLDDDNEMDSNGLSGAIHNVTKPEENIDHCTFSVDFGSAGVDAFLDLVHEIYLNEVKELRIGSFSMIS